MIRAKFGRDRRTIKMSDEQVLNQTDENMGDDTAATPVGDETEKKDGEGEGSEDSGM
jgi:hypothetical protein